MCRENARTATAQRALRAASSLQLAACSPTPLGSARTGVVHSLAHHPWHAPHIGVCLRQRLRVAQHTLDVALLHARQRQQAVPHRNCARRGQGQQGGAGGGVRVVKRAPAAEVGSTAEALRCHRRTLPLSPGCGPALTRRLAHNVQTVPQQQVVHSVDGTAQAVLHRKRGALRHPLRAV